ncbi:cellulase family glycosylhydrolase [Gracilibacillus xinjiangensis]|uniref:Cellulase family glycosylhydrolase n=1 Tax=Gracilibacillus xinjiangensis TaxID=1193282 RepID=A0ABV8WU81_9BACI
MKNYLAKVMIMIIVLLVVGTITSYGKEDRNTSINIEEYAQNMQPGWNLGNTYDAVGEDETAWGNPYVTKELIEKIATDGFKSIRIPLTFDQRMETADNYQINQDYLNRIDQTVRWALEEGLYVMINVHHDSWLWIETGMQENHDQTVTRFNAIWRQLADHFKDYSTNLMFESINEPRFSGTEEESLQYLDELNESFYRIVRESGGSNDVRPLVLPTLHTGSERKYLDRLDSFIQTLNDPNIMATVHYYGFWPFSVNIDGYTRFNDEVKNDIIQVFNRVHDTFTANGIPVVIGEYGLLGFDTSIGTIQQGEKLKFFEFMTYYAQQKNLVHMLWDNGQHLHRNSLEWSDPEFFDMLQTSWDTRSAVPNDNYIYLEKGKEITDKELSFDLNGNDFEGIYLDDQLLRESSDYTINGSTITFSQTFLKSLIASNKTGTIATITITFSSGVDWKIDVRQFSTPKLSDAEGTTASFRIPAEFHGDQLATMEAYYPDGTIAGPQNWTSFKEFGYTFTPNYEEGYIELKENFFNETNDGNVHLTFHFWSGKKVEYLIEKSGDIVETADEDIISKEFTDISGHWAKDSVQLLAKNHILHGYPDGAFRPNATISRAEIARIVATALGIEDGTPASDFSDVTGKEWYANDLYALADIKVIAGFTDGTFRPKAKVTRAELAAILGRALKYTEMTLQENNQTTEDFSDAEEFPKWAMEDIQTMVQHNIMQGFPDNRFGAANFTTRAEAAKALGNFLEEIGFLK